MAAGASIPFRHECIRPAEMWLPSRYAREAATIFSPFLSGRAARSVAF
jgi:hypothetical protein